MKNLWLFFSLAIFFIAPLNAASNTDKNSERIHYKCHLTLSDESEVIHGFVSIGKTKSEFEDNLLGRLVYAADGVTGLSVDVVHQCVKKKQRFTSKKARDLEAITPF